MSLEDVRAIEQPLMRCSQARTKGTQHSPFVMGQSMPILIVLSGKSLEMIITRLNGTLFWSLFLVRKHVRGEVLKDTAAIRTSAPVIPHSRAAARAGSTPGSVSG